jgi:CheY-like chemotaxis protein
MSSILYVEDDDLTRQTVGNRLRRLGYEVTAVASGEAALTAIGEKSPELALLDLELPGIDGIETLKLLRQRLPNLPIVVCSAHLDRCLCSQLEELGVACGCLLCKPVRFSLIAATVAGALAPENG